MAPTHTRVEKYDALKQKNRLDFIFKKKKEKAGYTYISIYLDSDDVITHADVCLFVFCKRHKKKENRHKNGQATFQRESERERERGKEEDPYVDA